MTYPAHIAAALSGTSTGQLAYWRSRRSGGPLLAPEHSTDGRALYSFRDVVALRTVAFLREDVSLQKIRKAVGTLRQLGNREHLSTYRLVADGDSIVWLPQESGPGRIEGVDLVRHPGQTVLATMDDILAPFTNAAGRAVPDFSAPRPKIQVDAEILAGYPVVLGTRIPFDIVADLVAAGVDPRKLRDYYPGVDANAARQAVDYAQYVDSIRDDAA